MKSQQIFRAQPHSLTTGVTGTTRGTEKWGGGTKVNGERHLMSPCASVPVFRPGDWGFEASPGRRRPGRCSEKRRSPRQRRGDTGRMSSKGGRPKRCGSCADCTDPDPTKRTGKKGRCSGNMAAAAVAAELSPLPAKRDSKPAAQFGPSPVPRNWRQPH